FVAPRHMRAIKETGNTLIAALDPHDNVGVLDSYFPNTDFFTEFERFDRHLEKLRRGGNQIDYISICSPNYLHDAHIRFALRHGADAICEKPLVLNPWNLDALEQIEQETGKKIHTILQLRLHPSIQQLKEKISQSSNKRHQIELTYITSRGKWYDYSWKGDLQKSGGVATNIGVHFFDMLIHIFGKAQNIEVEKHNPHMTSGNLILENADVKWKLSIDSNDLPEEAVKEGKRTFRNISVDGETLEFSGGFEDLHTSSYKHILSEGNFGISETRAAIEICHKIRTLSI
ncbi:MAG: Gfo/Idh/MocA family oxidoreductase, partial [Cyclobacteriaceae bacterium]|nr:Gfo/Idh/MocA family oxidoreductase [Cyclobacteriaceae bacterium]